MPKTTQGPSLPLLTVGLLARTFRISHFDNIFNSNNGICKNVFTCDSQPHHNSENIPFFFKLRVEMAISSSQCHSNTQCLSSREGVGVPTQCPRHSRGHLAPPWGAMAEDAACGGYGSRGGLEIFSEGFIHMKICLVQQRTNKTSRKH